MRENWLNPPDWTTTHVLEFLGSVDGPWSRFVADANARGIGTVRYPRVEARDEQCAKKLAKCTLTNLYNERPAWLSHAHAKLDVAVATASGFDADLTDEQIPQKTSRVEHRTCEQGNEIRCQTKERKNFACEI